MNWYISKIVFQVIMNGKEHLPQFDEQLRIVAASSKQEALNKALLLGQTEEGSIMNNQSQQLIHWKFINISALYQLKELLDGAEICSITHEPENAENFIDMIHQKAAYIQHNDILEILHLV